MNDFKEINDQHSDSVPDSEEYQADYSPQLTSAETFMLHAVANVVTIHKVNEADKIGHLKYFGAIVTSIVTLAIGIVKFGKSNDTDYLILGILLLLLYIIGTTILRKLFAIRSNSVTLASELGNIYTYFVRKYPDIEPYLGKSFRIFETHTQKVTVRGSDFFNFITILIINTAVLFSSVWFFVKVFIDSNSPIFILILLISEAIIITLNIFLFYQFQRTLTK